MATILTHADGNVQKGSKLVQCDDIWPILVSGKLAHLHLVCGDPALVCNLGFLVKEENNPSAFRIGASSVAPRL